MSTAPRILIVDDEVTLVDVLSRHLERRGYQPAEAFLVAEAVQAVDAASRDQLPFSVVLSDLFLPDGDGADVVRAVREKLPGTPVVVMTGSGSISGAVKAMRLGAVTVLEKPFSMDALDAELGRAVEAAQAPATGVNLYAALDDLEDKLIREALQKAEGNHARAARYLGLNRTTLLMKLRRMERS